MKKYRLTPSTRGFQVEGVSDNTLYLVCVVTRGSAYRRMLNNNKNNNTTTNTSGSGLVNGSGDSADDLVDDEDFTADDADDVTAEELIHTYR